MSPASHRIASLAALLALTIIVPSVARAQRGDDSVALERAIAAEHPDLPFIASARLRLLRQLRQSDVRGGRAMIGFMSRRAPSWLTPAEDLLAETLIADISLLRDPTYLDRLLAGAALEPKQHASYQDNLYRSEREMVRERSESLQDRFVADEPSPDELLFFNLLVNHIYTQGFRAQERLNRRVDDFARRYPASPLAPLAMEHIRKDYAEEPIGVAFTAGYASGEFSGDIAKRYNYFHGPMVGGEVYLYDFTVAAWLDFGTAKGPRDFTAGGRVWRSGSSSLINGALDLGYELRFGRLAVTPVAGLALQSLRGVDSVGADPSSLPRTHDRLGIDLGVIVGYRIPFDLGPHIDFRVKLGCAHAALADYDPGFSGALWYAQLAFALVQRPYVGR